MLHHCWLFNVKLINIRVMISKQMWQDRHERGRHQEEQSCLLIHAPPLFYWVLSWIAFCGSGLYVQCRRWLRAMLSQLSDTTWSLCLSEKRANGNVSGSTISKNVNVRFPLPVDDNYAYLHAQVNARVKSQVNCCRLITALHSLLLLLLLLRPQLRCTENRANERNSWLQIFINPWNVFCCLWSLQLDRGKATVAMKKGNQIELLRKKIFFWTSLLLCPVCCLMDDTWRTGYIFPSPADVKMNEDNFRFSLNRVDLTGKELCICRKNSKSF